MNPKPLWGPCVVSDVSIIWWVGGVEAVWCHAAKILEGGYKVRNINGNVRERERSDSRLVMHDVRQGPRKLPSEVRVAAELKV